MRDRHTENGFALVVVMLVSMVVLLGAVTSASVATLGTRRNAADERVTFQAQLLAESGINSFNARAQRLGYSGELNLTDLDAWMDSMLPDGTTLRSVDLSGSSSLGDSSAAYLSIADVDIFAEKFTVRSDGTLITAAETQSTKNVFMDVALRKRAPDFKMPSALTAYGDIWAGGESSVRGSATGWDGLLDGITSTTSSAAYAPGETFQIDVGNAELIHRGQYVDIEGETYRVEGRSDTTGGATLSLTPVNPDSMTMTINTGVPVNVKYAAVTIDVPSNSDLTRLPVDDASKFMVGKKIYVDSVPDLLGVVTTYTATVTALDAESDVLTVDWDLLEPSDIGPITEGTAVRPDIYGASSSGAVTEESCTPRPNKPCPDNIDTTDPNSVHVPASDALFEQTFGMTKEEMKSKADYVGMSMPSPTSGISWLTSSQTLTADYLCGSGIVFVEGDLIFNGTCSAGFDGVIYVTGKMDQQGNSVMKGAIVVEQNVKVTGTGNHKIQWDPVAILKARNLVVAWEIEPIAGTWRQR